MGLRNKTQNSFFLRAAMLFMNLHASVRASYLHNFTCGNCSKCMESKAQRRLQIRDLPQVWGVGEGAEGKQGVPGGMTLVWELKDK